MPFSEISAVISDMDGVLWRGDEPLPGLLELFDYLRTHHVPFALATNNSSKTQADYVAKLARMGVNGIPESAIITSGTAAVDFLRTRFPDGGTVHILGGDGLRQVVSDAGFTLSNGDAQVVVVGIDTTLTYEKLQRAMRAILNGALFVGTNPDVTYPAPDGLVPGAGTTIAALQAATGYEPIIIGKPQAPMFETALRLLGTSPQQTLMIGDRLETDIQGAINIGLKTAFVFTGVTTRDQLSESGIIPDSVHADLGELVRSWG